MAEREDLTVRTAAASAKQAAPQMVDPATRLVEVPLLTNV
jgi:hypothetical protein